MQHKEVPDFYINLTSGKKAESVKCSDSGKEDESCFYR